MIGKIAPPVYWEAIQKHNQVQLEDEAMDAIQRSQPKHCGTWSRSRWERRSPTLLTEKKLLPRTLSLRY